MPHITLLDAEWDRDDGLVSAPMPDRNVILKLSEELNDAIWSARRYIKMLVSLHGKPMDKAYIAIQAPRV